MGGWISGVWKNIKSFFGISSPSKLMAKTIGKPMAQGMAKGILDNAKLVDKAMESMAPETSWQWTLQGGFNDSYTLGTRKASTMSVSLSDSAVGQIINGFKAALTDQGDTVLIMNDRVWPGRQKGGACMIVKYENSLGQVIDLNDKTYFVNKK